MISYVGDAYRGLQRTDVADALPGPPSMASLMVAVLRARAQRETLEREHAAVGAAIRYYSGHSLAVTCCALNDSSAA